MKRSRKTNGKTSGFFEFFWLKKYRLVMNIPHILCTNVLFALLFFPGRGGAKQKLSSALSSYLESFLITKLSAFIVAPYILMSYLYRLVRSERILLPLPPATIVSPNKRSCRKQRLNTLHLKDSCW